jgi:hypothetical protein
MSTDNSTEREAAPAYGRGKYPSPKQDFAASLVVFLVALPLCVGVAVASGVPAELGLVTGVVGGVVTGLMRGSSLQVSGPAAGLTVLVFEAVDEFGLPALGVIVLATGVLQMLMGALKLGRYFRAISVSVVEGMLAGIGLVLIAGQLYSVVGAKAPDSGIGKLAGLPSALIDAAQDGRTLVSLGIGAGTIAVLVLWRRMPPRLRAVPGPLAAVGLDRVRGVPVQRGGRGPYARRPAHRVRQGTLRAGHGQRRVRGPRRPAHDRGDRAQRGQCAGGRPYQGVPRPARGVSSPAVRSPPSRASWSTPVPSSFPSARSPRCGGRTAARP